MTACVCPEGPAGHVIQAAGCRYRCCDMHNATCEPSELCCGSCSEVAHPRHPAGIPCVLEEPGRG